MVILHSVNENVKDFSPKFKFKLQNNCITFYSYLGGYVTKYSRMDQVTFVEDSLLKIWSDMVCLKLSSTNFTYSILEYLVPYYVTHGDWLYIGYPICSIVSI